MARAFFGSFTAHSYSYATEMIDKTHRQGAFAAVELLPRRLLALAHAGQWLNSSHECKLSERRTGGAPFCLFVLKNSTW